MPDDNVTAEERFEHRLRFDPEPYFKQWRFARWKERMVEEKRIEVDEANKQFRLEVVRRLIQSGKWEEGQWGIE